MVTEEGDAAAAERVRRYQRRAGEELYDVSKDWSEWKNLANDPEYAQAKAELRKQLDAWMLAQGDKGKQTELEAREHQGRGRKKKDGKKAGKKKKEKK